MIDLIVLREQSGPWLYSNTAARIANKGNMTLTRADVKAITVEAGL